MEKNSKGLGVALRSAGPSGGAVASEGDPLSAAPNVPNAAERPILFSGPMVRAILNGRKTQTRRIVKPGKHIKIHPNAGPYVVVGYTGGFAAEMCNHSDTKTFLSLCPYGKPGDRLWVRETHYVERAGGPGGEGRFVLYKATDVDAPVGRWTPSLHMFRWASRITLEVVSVRVERLQDISEADAKAEGCGVAPALPDCTNVEVCGRTFRAGYAALWSDINGPGSWGANPWVWVVEFSRVSDRSGTPQRSEEYSGERDGEALRTGTPTNKKS